MRLLGKSGPPLVLLHGLIGSGRYWGGAYDRLAETHRLIVPDLLGFGGSSQPASGYGPDDHAQAVIACLDALHVREPALVGAHSLGVLIALRLALSHPERVGAVAGFGPPIYPDPTTARRRAARTGTMARLFVSSRFARPVCRWVCDHRGLAARLAIWSSPHLPAEVAADGVRHSWASYSETLERVILAAEAHRWLTAAHVPVRLVAGRFDRAVDLGFLTPLAARSGDVEIEAWPGGHDLPLAQSDRCAAFLEALGAALVEPEGSQPV